MNLVEVQALVNYYSQRGFYRHVQSLCKDVLKKRSNEPLLLFWRAFAMSQEGNVRKDFNV
jgi:tetratricopeptide repeat protein 21B